MNQLADVALLDGEDISVVEGVDFLPVDGRGVVDVVGGVEGAESPLHFSILRGEEGHFNDDAALFGFGHKGVETIEVGWVPFVEIEFVAAAGVTGRVTAQPGCDEFAGLRSEIVALDAEGFCGDFNIAAAEEARVVEAFRLQSGEIFGAIEIGVEDGAVVLAAGDEGDGFALIKKVMRVDGIELDGRGGSSLRNGETCRGEEERGLRCDAERMRGAGMRNGGRVFFAENILAEESGAHGCDPVLGATLHFRGWGRCLSTRLRNDAERPQDVLSSSAAESLSR